MQEGEGGGASKKAAGTVTILLVEDDEVVADTMRETLEYQGWKVVVCADGRDALKRISGGTRYDLLMLDNGYSQYMKNVRYRFIPKLC